MRDHVATALKCVAVIFCGIAGQRMAIATTAETVSPGVARGTSIYSLLPAGSGRIRLAQADDSGIPEAQETAPFDASAPPVAEQPPATEPPPVAEQPPGTSSESLSVDRQLSPRHRRRKPKMAGVPSGTQTVEEVLSAPLVAKDTQGAATTTAPIAPQPGAQQPGAPGAQGVATATAPIAPQPGAQQPGAPGAQGVATATAPVAPQPGAQQPEAPGAATAAAPAAPPPVAQEPGKTVSGAEAGGAEEQEMEDVNAPGVIARARAEKEQRGLWDRKYGLAPVKWSGVITETVGLMHTYLFAGAGLRLNPYSSNQVGANSQTISYGSINRIQTVMLRGNTYIVQPWIATVQGRFGVASGQSRSTAGDDTRINGLIGSAEMKLFNRSRFPGTINYTSTDSRTDANENSNLSNLSSGSANGDTQRKKLTIKNGYRSLDSIFRGWVSYMHDSVATQQMQTVDATASTSKQVTLTTSRGIDSNLSGAFSTKLGRSRDQPFSMNLSHDVYYGSTSFAATPSLINTTISTRADTISGDHRYTPEDTLLTLRTNGMHFLMDTEGMRSTSQQLTSNATWQPEEEDNPLVVRGMGRIFSYDSFSQGAENRTRGLNSNVLLTYNAWRDRRLNGGASVSEIVSNGAHTLATTQFARGDYIPAVLRFGKRVYTQSYNAGFMNSTATGSPSDLNVYGGATHSLVAPYEFNLYGYRSGITSSFSQALSVQRDQINGASETLTSTGNVSWRPRLYKRLLDEGGKVAGVREAETARASANVTVNTLVYDTRTYGYGAGHSDSVKLSLLFGGLGGFMAKAAGYGATGTFSLDTMYQSSGGLRTNELANAAWGWGTKYDYVYKKPRAFGVKGLDYGLILHAAGNTGLAAQRSESIAAGVPRSGTSQSGYQLNYGVSLKQALRYRIGQNEAMLTINAGETMGVKSASLMMLFRAWRNFGN